MADITPIARIETPFGEKFGVPRQSGIADCPGRIVFEPAFRDPEAVRGLEGFSHVWLIWQFDRALRPTWSPTVRPPRLGGNQRMGVFATRSPFRPNGLGLSAVELEQVSLDEISIDLFTSTETTPEEELISQEGIHRLNLAIDSLPAKCKMAFKLVREDKLKYKEVAAILDISVKTLEAHLTNAVRKLRETLADDCI